MEIITDFNEDGVPNDGLTYHKESSGMRYWRVTLSRMKTEELTEMDGIPEDVWMCLGQERIDMLTIIVMQSVYEQDSI